MAVKLISEAHASFEPTEINKLLALAKKTTVTHMAVVFFDGSLAPTWVLRGHNGGGDFTYQATIEFELVGETPIKDLVLEFKVDSIPDPNGCDRMLVGLDPNAPWAEYGEEVPTFTGYPFVAPARDEGNLLGYLTAIGTKPALLTHNVRLDKLTETLKIDDVDLIFKFSGVNASILTVSNIDEDDSLKIGLKPFKGSESQFYSAFAVEHDLMSLALPIMSEDMLVMGHQDGCLWLAESARSFHLQTFDVEDVEVEDDDRKVGYTTAISDYDFKSFGVVSEDTVYRDKGKRKAYRKVSIPNSHFEAQVCRYESGLELFFTHEEFMKRVDGGYIILNEALTAAVEREAVKEVVAPKIKELKPKEKKPIVIVPKVAPIKGMAPLGVPEQPATPVTDWGKVAEDHGLVQPSPLDPLIESLNNAIALVRDRKNTESTIETDLIHFAMGFRSCVEDFVGVSSHDDCFALAQCFSAGKGKPPKPPKAKREALPKPAPKPRVSGEPSKKDQLAKFLTDSPRSVADLVQFSGTAESAIRAQLRAHLPISGYTVGVTTESGAIVPWWPTELRGADKASLEPKYQIIGRD